MEPDHDVDLMRLDALIEEKYQNNPEALVMVLQDVSAEYNHLPQEALRYVAEKLDIPLSKVYSVATFYTAFHLEPRGRHIIKVCLGTACHIRGAGQLVEELQRQLGIGPDETTEDLKFTVKTVNCVGACAMAPVVIVGEKYFGTAKSRAL